MPFLSDVQTEIPSIINRWKMSEASASTYVSDDVGGFVFPRLGTPQLGLPGYCRNDPATSGMGGVGIFAAFAAGWNQWQGAVAAYSASPVCIEAVTAAEPAGRTFNLFYSPGLVRLQVIGTTVSFTLWDNAAVAHTVTAASLKGYAQLVQAVYDAQAQLQLIYVDGVQVASAALNVTPSTTQAMSFVGTTHTSQVIDGITNTQGILVGSTITGSGVPANTLVSAITSDTAITISNATTTSLVGTALVAGAQVEICAPLSQSLSCQAICQDLALYSAPLSLSRVTQHFQAFRQILSDPGHVKQYAQIGIAS